MPAVQSVTTDLDPNTANAKTMKTDQTVDLYGNLTQSRIYEYGNLSTPARTINCTYFFPNAHYLRNLPASFQSTDGVKNVSLFANTYDGYGGANPLTQVIGSPTMHATGTYNTTYTTRGNPTYLTSPGKATTLTYNILGEVIKAVTNGQTVEWTYSASNNFGAPTQITPNLCRRATRRRCCRWRARSISTPTTPSVGPRARRGRSQASRPSPSSTR